jgi:hypothetical protein
LFWGLEGLFLQIDVTEIVVHKSHQPDAIVDLLDAHGLTRERSAEIYFLFKDADPFAVGNQSCPIVEGLGELSEATIGPSRRFVDGRGALHIESFMWALVVKLMKESVEPSNLACC